MGACLDKASIIHCTVLWFDCLPYNPAIWWEGTQRGELTARSALVAPAIRLPAVLLLPLSHLLPRFLLPLAIQLPCPLPL